MIINWAFRSYPTLHVHHHLEDNISELNGRYLKIWVAVLWNEICATNNAIVNIVILEQITVENVLTTQNAMVFNIT